jgi:hypothetical protein
LVPPRSIPILTCGFYVAAHEVVWHFASTLHATRAGLTEFRCSSAGIVIEVRADMLVEGGYLHSMKQLLEIAADADAPLPKKGSRSFLARWRKRTPFSVLTPLKRLGLILLRGPYQG